jgi:hypothetical protein
MVLVLPENPSFGQRIGRGLGAGVVQGASAFADQFASKKQNEKLNEQMQMENEQIKKLTGLDLSNVRDPAQRKEFVSRHLQGLESEKEFGREKELFGLEQEGKLTENLGKLTRDQQERIAPLVSGLQTVKQMRKLGSTGYLGPASAQGFFTGLLKPEVRKARAEYEQLGKSLINLASNIPIRNQKEFETLADQLYDPALTDATREGILDAMERIITQNMQQYSGFDMGGMQGSSAPQEPPKERPPLSSFHR